jgi:hypothetical protein
MGEHLATFVIAGILIGGAIILATTCMWNARTPLAGDDHH